MQKLSASDAAVGGAGDLGHVAPLTKVGSPMTRYAGKSTFWLGQRHAAVQLLNADNRVRDAPWTPPNAVFSFFGVLFVSCGKVLAQCRLLAGGRAKVRL